MFGRRADGIKLKHLDPIFRLMPCIMRERNDSQVLFKQDVSLDGIQEYIQKSNEAGKEISLLDIFIASFVRIIAERPKLNRFAMFGRIYTRKDITICMAIKKTLSDEGEETIVKMHFNGTESLFEIHDKIQALIEENKKESTDNSMDKLVKVLNKIPDGMLRRTVSFLRFLDHHGMLPMSIIEASPFHTSAFVTNVGSIGIDSIYHHLYNFGTTSLFVSLGKKKTAYLYEDDDVVKDKIITFAFVGDERICDGYYYAYTMRTLAKYLKRPELLEAKLEAREPDPEL